MKSWGVDQSFGTSCLRLRGVRDVLRQVAQGHRQGKAVLARDLVVSLKRGASTIHSQLEKLVEEGLIVLEGGQGQTKSIQLTEHGAQMALRCGSPILGTVPAGTLRAVPETDGHDMEGCQLYLDSWDSELPPNEDFGVLVVKGDSMIGECIRHGDRVQLRLGVSLSDLEDGEIAAVMVGDDYEATLKYVHFNPHQGTVTLKAANPSYDDIVATAGSVKVVGSLHAVVRTFNKKGRRW